MYIKVIHKDDKTYYLLCIYDKEHNKRSYFIDKKIYLALKEVVKIVE